MVKQRLKKVFFCFANHGCILFHIKVIKYIKAEATCDLSHDIHMLGVYTNFHKPFSHSHHINICSLLSLICIKRPHFQ